MLLTVFRSFFECFTTTSPCLESILMRKHRHLNFQVLEKRMTMSVDIQDIQISGARVEVEVQADQPGRLYYEIEGVGLWEKGRFQAGHSMLSFIEPNPRSGQITSLKAIEVDPEGLASLDAIYSDQALRNDFAAMDESFIEALAKSQDDAGIALRTPDGNFTTAAQFVNIATEATVKLPLTTTYVHNDLETNPEWEADNYSSEAKTFIGRTGSMSQNIGVLSAETELPPESALRSSRAVKATLTVFVPAPGNMGPVTPVVIMPVDPRISPTTATYSNTGDPLARRTRDEAVVAELAAGWNNVPIPPSWVNQNAPTVVAMQTANSLPLVGIEFASGNNPDAALRPNLAVQYSSSLPVQHVSDVISGSEADRLIARGAVSSPVPVVSEPYAPQSQPSAGVTSILDRVRAALPTFVGLTGNASSTAEALFRGDLKGTVQGLVGLIGSGLKFWSIFK